MPLRMATAPAVAQELATLFTRVGLPKQTAVQYLGFNIGWGRVLPIQDKGEVLAKAATPTTRKKIQSFLGLANYYRRFVPRFSTLASPLIDLLKGGGKGNKAIQLTPQTLTAFKALKRLCASKAGYTPLCPMYPLLYTLIHQALDWEPCWLKTPPKVKDRSVTSVVSCPLLSINMHLLRRKP